MEKLNENLAKSPQKLIEELDEEINNVINPVLKPFEEESEMEILDSGTRGDTDLSKYLGHDFFMQFGETGAGKTILKEFQEK